MGVRIAGFVICLMVAVSTAGAEMYQWIDENGAVTFKDTPPPPSKKGKQKVKVYKESDFDPAPPVPAAPAGRSDRRGTAAPASQAPAPEKTRFSGTVEIYVTDWCGYCKQAQRYMSSRGIPFVAYDIEKDRAANQRHKELGGRGVPLIIIGSSKMSGFSPDVLEHHLNNNR